MKKIVAAILAVAFVAVGIAIASTECKVEVVDGAKVTVACEAGKAGDKVNMKAGEVSAACVVDSVADGKTVMTCKDASVKVGDKVTVETATAVAENKPEAPKSDDSKKEKKPVEGC